MTNIFFAHSGGVTSVLNHIASSVIRSAQMSPHVDRIYVGKNGILGALNNELYDVTDFDEQQLISLCHTPASAFGSCRYKLKCPISQASEFNSIMNTFKQHNITGFIYNGGNDSQDTTLKLHTFASQQDYPLYCIGIPKTIDNDLPMVDCSPGYASAAKYIATSALECSLDVLSMCESSTKLFIMEVMGRHAGWLAAASAMAHHASGIGPHLILLPEVTYEADKVIQATQAMVEQHGYCVIVASEGIRDQTGQLVSQQQSYDAFGHAQLGGVAPIIAKHIHQATQFKYHYCVADYLQRSAGHLTSAVDHDHANALGAAAVQAVNQQQSGLMVGIKRTQQSPYRWCVDTFQLDDIANKEYALPKHFIREDQLGVTQAFIDYLSPLIQGETAPRFKSGLPDYFQPLNIRQTREEHA